MFNSVLKCLKKGVYFSLASFMDAFFLLLSFCLLLYLSLTGRYTTYIHPRYAPFLYTSLPLLLLAFVYQIKFALRPKREGLRFRHFLFSLPFLFLFLTTSVNFTFNSSIYPLYAEGRVKNVEYENNILSDEGTADKHYSEDNSAFGFSFTAKKDEAEELPVVSGAIKIGSEDYAAFLSHAFRLNASFSERRFTFLARIEKNSFIPEDKILLGRPIMLCCAADSQSLGLLSEVDEAKWRVGSWVYVTGTLVYDELDLPLQGRKKVPTLKHLDLREAPTPQSIYSFFFSEKEINLTENP